MNTSTIKPSLWSSERKALVALALIFAGIMISAWIYAMSLRQTVSSSSSVMNIDVSALLGVEKLRSLSAAEMDEGRAFFLLGSSALYADQKRDKQIFEDSLADFEKRYSLPQLPEILKHVRDLEQENQNVFDQAMKYREKKTESKIIGQFYQAKTTPIRAHLNQAFDEIVRAHNTELEHARIRAREAATQAQVQIPRGMVWLTGLLTFLFLSMSVLVIRLLRERPRQVAERDRLFQAAKKAVQARDEISVAMAEDLKEPLAEINRIAESMKTSSDIADKADLIKSTIVSVESLVSDILDQARADMGNMTLRLDQIGIDSILDEARLQLQPLAKQHDVRLQFDSVNPPVLAFFDRERVLRILSNLVGNAIKFSPKHSKVIVKVRSDLQFIYVSISDSGPGIPEKQLPEIFDHFWQAQKTANQGPGLGLAIVKTLVEAHGGTVRVDSPAGRGTTFTFSLPRRRPVGAQMKRSNPVVRHIPRPSIAVEIQDGPSL